MSRLSEFIYENEVRIGEDFQTNFPLYNTSLQEAFFHYFETFRETPDLAALVTFVPDRKSLAWESGANDNVVFTLLSFHRFFELFLKDVLSKINPMLKVRFPERQADVFEYLDGKIDADALRTVEFPEALKRFLHAYKYFDESSEQFQNHLKPFSFLTSQAAQETMEVLTTWRNRIMHNGKTIPNVIALDFLVTQHVMPLVDEIIKTHKEFVPHYYTTKSGVKVIAKILEIKLAISEYKDFGKNDELRWKLTKLGHLKEMGRTTYIEPFKQFMEPVYSKIEKRYERFSSAESESSFFKTVKKCHCCGVESLVVYNKEYLDIFTNKIGFNKWCKCLYCDFMMYERHGDPFIFGLSDERIFD